MLARELMLRTLRINRVPAPRVIVPGPKTRFPLTFEAADGSCARIRDLAAARAVSGSCNMIDGFFAETLPVTETCRVEVRGLKAWMFAGHEDGDASADSSIAGSSRACLPDAGSVDGNEQPDLAVRAAYCLGFPAALVEIGLGPGGPWVLDVKEQLGPAGGARKHATLLETAVETARQHATLLEAAVETARQRVTFLGAAVECARQEELGDDRYLVLKTVCAGEAWPKLQKQGFISSPMPFPGLPLTTRLVFRGIPTAWLLRALDRSVALVGMMLSPSGETAQRNFTREGVLGSWRQGEGTFEYLAVPSLMWHPAGLRAVMIVADRVASEPHHGSGGPAANFGWYEWQKAYYASKKSYFLSEFERLVNDFGPGALSTKAQAHPPEAQASQSKVSISPSRRTPVLSVMKQALPAWQGMEANGDIFGIETDRFMRLQWMAEEAGLSCYVFFPDAGGFPSGRDSVNGWFHAKRSGWARRIAPAPDIIYDRHIPGILPGGHLDDVALALAVRLPHSQFINSLPFATACRDKFETHRILEGDSFCREHLPAMISVEGDSRGAERVMEFLVSHTQAHLKPREGTSSKGVSVLSLGKAGRDAGSAGRDAGSAGRLGDGPRDLHGEDEILAALNALRALRVRYVLQESIDMVRLPHGMGGAFEVRVICQKGGAGAWRRTGMVCRVNPGPEFCVIPGREVHMRVSHILPMAFPGSSRVVAKTMEAIRELGRRIPPLLEEASGCGGEMSIDLGIDRAGKPWLVEVNSKPATLFRDTGAFDLRELSLRRIVNYALCLYGGR